jgi:DNA-binding beta-propeller fold protein YncE
MALALSALLAACGGSGSHGRVRTQAASLAPARPAAPPTAPRAARAASPPPLQALVTAETESRLLVVALPSGHVVRTIPLPSDPEDIAAEDPAWGNGRLAVVTSASAGKVSVLKGRTLRVVKVFGGLNAPHIVELWPVPSGFDAYVTDDARGTLTVIDLRRERVLGTVRVGANAHHMGFDLIDQTAWVALGESASTIVILNTEDVAHPKVIDRFDPGFEVHDLAFSADGNRVWVTSANRPYVTVFDAADQHVLFRVPAGPPPQHVALVGSYAYLTSGYGSTIERVEARTGRVLAKASSPYGSFELAADDRYVVVSSLLRGTLAIYTPGLKLLGVVHLAPVTREVALSSPAGSPP